MGIAGKIFQFYINSSTHLGLAVVALSEISRLHLGGAFRAELLLFIFFGTITGYNFVKYAGIAKLHHRSLTRNLKVIQLFSLLAFLALIYFSFQVKFRVLEVAAVLGLLTLLYAFPVFNKKNLRSLAGVKVYVIATIWAGVSVLFPAVEAGQGWPLDLWLEFIQRFLFVLVLLVPFEIRDLKYDAAQLRTIPQKYGVRRTRYLGIFLLVLILLLEVFRNDFSWNSFLADGLAYGLTALLVLNAREDQGRYYSTFLVEGIPILWLALLLLFSR